MYENLKALIEKYNVIVEKEGGQKVFWDEKNATEG